MIRLKNKKNHSPNPSETDVYIGRGSPLGNPFPIRGSDTRNVVCDKYENYFYSKVYSPGDPLRDEVIRIYKLAKAGRTINLICFCYPLKCHGETVLGFLVKHLDASCFSEDDTQTLF